MEIQFNFKFLKAKSKPIKVYMLVILLIVFFFFRIWCHSYLRRTNGLTCACYLAKAGLKVLVSEQYHTIGGMIIQFLENCPRYILLLLKTKCNRFIKEWATVTIYFCTLTTIVFLVVVM
jgi:hypothetical protein